MLVFNDGDMVGGQTTQGIDAQRDVIVVGWVMVYVILVHVWYLLTLGQNSTQHERLGRLRICVNRYTPVWDINLLKSAPRLTWIIHINLLSVQLSGVHGI